MSTRITDIPRRKFRSAHGFVWDIIFIVSYSCVKLRAVGPVKHPEFVSWSSGLWRCAVGHQCFGDPCCFHVQGNIDLWNVGILPQLSRYSDEATSCMVGVLGFDSRRGLGIFLFTTASRADLGPTQPPIQWVTGDLSLGLKRSGREANLSPPSSAEIEECVELHFHPTIRLHDVVLS
jgi:hypothetical protein